MAIAFHLVAKALPLLSPLRNRASCLDLWWRLRKKFPNIAACVLMPDHVHLLIFGRDLNCARWELGVELRAWTQRFHPRSHIWPRIPLPQAVPDFRHLKRQIRYVHLNPCRSGLASDPLEWEWSTHRDLTGCTLDAWPDMEMLGRVFEVAPSRLGETAHRYISSDPSVSVIGTPMIRDPRVNEPMIATLSDLFRTAAVAAREKEFARRGGLRDLVVHAAAQLGVAPAPEKLNMSRKTWNRALMRKVDRSSVRVILKLLADPRTRSHSGVVNGSGKPVRRTRMSFAHPE